ncbi:MAG: PaaI family thioesterase [Gammaproteobacteria bacterium]|uniref:PaaI family thioesterase n=1 Tax=SAR86 cluster bacterium TaxID=2030880 RepID=A0A520MRK9_9GAMM|nr:MAG: PaaI family thioesterase [SAR86 cluster bacterium]|tara:strand:- start:1221 stop:1634 length:414 start_codon:yes stop_codon:yes gene_type:complete
MSDSIQKFLDFHKEAGGTGKLFNFELVEYREGYLELDAEFTDETLNPDGSVQGGMMTSMLDDVTALLLIIKSNATIYPSSTNLHSHHHRPLFKGKVTAKAFLIKQGKTIASVRGEIYDGKGRLATTLMHTVFIQKRS